jgi:hypothetical protein
MIKNNIMPNLNYLNQQGLDGKGRSRKEIDSILKRMRQPGYRRINKGLNPDATPIEKAKYEICQNILRYKRENSLDEKELTKKIKIKPGKLDYLLFYHIEHFTLDELVLYASEVFSPFQIGIIEARNKEYSSREDKENKVQPVALG